MRILHTSDWHVGRTLHGISLAHAHEMWCDHLVEVTRSESPDAVLVSGDVYDRAIPPLESISLLSDVLARLAEITTVVVTPGNHDSATRLGFGASLFSDPLRMRTRVAEVGAPVELEQGLVYALPYLDPEMTRGELSDADSPVGRSHEAVVGAAMGRVNADLAVRRALRADVPAVVMAHAFVTGGSASESERDLRVGGVEDVPGGVFGARADYVALGHLHGPQRIGGSDRIRYAGSPVAFSFSERFHQKSSALVTVACGRQPEVELIPAPVERPLTQIRGLLDDLLSGRYAHAAEHWVKAEVTDPHRPDYMRERLREAFPQALVTVHTPEGAVHEVRGSAVNAASDPVAIAAEFVADVRGEAPTDAEHAVIAAAYERAREAGA